MRVIYVVSLFPCWSETFIVREIRELLRMGVDVRIVSLRHPSETLVQSDARELQDRVIYPAPVLRTAVAAASAVLRHPLRELGRLFEIGGSMSAPPIERCKSLGAWWRITGLSAAMRKFDPDLLHAHWATYPSTAAMIAAERLDRPFSFTCHAHDIFTADHLLRPKLRRCAFGVTISDFNRRYLAQRLPNAGAERLRVVHCGIEPDVMPFHDGGRQSDPPLVLAVGRLDPIKGFADLVDACRDLRDRGMTFQCDIVGDGPLRAELQQRIDAAGLSAAVRLRGACKQEEVRGLLDRAVGGVGLRRGRRDPDHLQVGDALDFWRVEAFEPDRRLRLAAEMKLPGRAWLEFEVTEEEDGATIRQTAEFDPAGLAGLLYWYGVYPLHVLVFRGMLRGIAARATL